MIVDFVIFLCGYLLCLKCGKVFIGSVLKGCYKYYYYYYCIKGCIFREKVFVVNDKIVEEIIKYVRLLLFLEFYKQIIIFVYNSKIKYN